MGRLQVSASFGRAAGVALGLMAVSDATTGAFAATLMALTFDESPRPAGTSLPFQTADISGNGNHGYIYDLAGGQVPFDGPAFLNNNPQFTQFAPESGDAHGPAGPFGGGTGHFLNVLGDYVEVTPPGMPGQTPNNDLSFSGDFTVEFWFRTGEQTFQLFALDDAATRNTIKFFLQGGAGPGKVSLNLNGVEGEGPFLLSANTYDDTQWHHVAAVRDAIAGTGTLHIDGGAVNGGETITQPVNASWTFSEPYASSYRFNGSGDNAFRSIVQFDELRISDVALTEAQLGFHGTIVTPPQPPAPTPVPVIYFPFDQTHAGIQTGGNGLDQLPLHDFMGRQDGIVVGPFSAYDNPGMGQTFFFDDQPGGGSSIGDGLAKFGGALHVRTLLPEGWGIILGDSVAGNSDYIVSSTTADLFDRNGNEEWTLEFWYRGKLDEPHGLIGHSDGANVPRLQVDLLKEGSLGAGPGDTGKVRTTVLNEDETISLTMITTGTGFSDNNWHHYAVVRSVEPGGTNNDFITVYLDGGSGNGGETVQAVADEGHPGFVDWSDPARAPFPDDSPAMFFIGRTYSGADGGDDFDIDDFAYFNEALSVEQLGYNKPAFSPPPRGTLFIIGE